MNLNKIMLLCAVLFIVFSIVYMNDKINNNPQKNQSKNTIEVFLDNEKNKKVSEKEAVKNVKDYLQKTGSYVPSIIEVDSADGNYYVVHAYEIIKNEDESHTATTGWFNVNMNTGEVIDIMN